MGDLFEKINSIIIRPSERTPELQKRLEEFRTDTLNKMEEIKKQFGLTSLDIAHGLPSHIIVFVNSEFKFPPNEY